MGFLIRGKFSDQCGNRAPSTSYPGMLGMRRVALAGLREAEVGPFADP